MNCPFCKKPMNQEICMCGAFKCDFNSQTLKQKIKVMKS